MPLSLSPFIAALCQSHPYRSLSPKVLNIEPYPELDPVPRSMLLARGRLRRFELDFPFSNMIAFGGTIDSTTHSHNSDTLRTPQCVYTKRKECKPRVSDLLWLSIGKYPFEQLLDWDIKFGDLSQYWPIIFSLKLLFSTPIATMDEAASKTKRSTIACTFCRDRKIKVSGRPL